VNVLSRQPAGSLCLSVFTSTGWLTVCQCKGFLVFTSAATVGVCSRAVQAEGLFTSVFKGTVRCAPGLQ
jgi:hypothetical protein